MMIYPSPNLTLSWHSSCTLISPPFSPPLHKEPSSKSVPFCIPPPLNFQISPFSKAQIYIFIYSPSTCSFRQTGMQNYSLANTALLISIDLPLRKGAFHTLNFYLINNVEDIVVFLAKKWDYNNFLLLYAEEICKQFLQKNENLN